MPNGPTWDLFLFTEEDRPFIVDCHWPSAIWFGMIGLASLAIGSGKGRGSCHHHWSVKQKHEFMFSIEDVNTRIPDPDTFFNTQTLFQ